MKTYYLVFISCVGLFLAGCGESVLDSRYTLKMPDLPQSWESVLGDPYWRVEWVNDHGDLETMTIRGDGSTEISLPQTWVSAVSASPFWPDRELRPGIFKPAGAIFPFDVSGKNLVLSWRGGVDAVLYWELAKAYYGQESAGNSSVPRLPQNFDWPRFRELFDDPALNAEIRADPWLADWQDIAARIVQSGFDRRRLVPEARSDLEIPVGPGPWIGVSPFAPPLVFESVPVFSVRQTADTWVSREGILRCNTQTWILLY